jgi:putative heme-binding domain-containing protein
MSDLQESGADNPDCLRGMGRQDCLPHFKRAFGASACFVFLLAITLFHRVEAAPPLTIRNYRDFAMNHDGDWRRGKELFFADQSTACARCHTIDGTAGRAGPDLYAAGDKFPRWEMIRAVLEPSAEIAIGYGATTIETKDGETFCGIIKQVSDSWMELMMADGKSVRVETNNIEHRTASALSLMPEGLQTGMTVQQFTDLVEFLVSLKQSENALTSNRGMPSSIAELSPPVPVIPFFREELRFPHAFVHKPGDVRSGLVWFGQIPGVSNAFLVVHQTGKIWVLEKKPEGDQKTLFGDFSRELFNERGPNGLLGLAFHPRFRENRQYYLKHQVFEDNEIATTVVEKIATADLRHDLGEPSRRLLKVIATTQDHTGGCLQFGPDGFLYIGMGDTGPQTDPQGHGQNRMTLLGKMLRIDVNLRSDGKPYGIPMDNPFREKTDALPEIWAWGFREPWRFSFDSLTGDLWVGDVGQDRVEEVDIVRSGENLGWNVFEGFEPFSNRYRKQGVAYTPPVFAYKRKFGNSVTGGFVFRGDKKSSFYGVYICGDYTSKRIWGIRQEDRALTSVRQIATSPQGIASFGTDDRGNIYVVGYEGMIYKLDLANAHFE